MSKETNLRYEQPHRPSRLFEEYTKQLKANDNLLINDIDQNMLLAKEVNENAHDQKELHDKWFEKSHVKVKAKEYETAQKERQKELKLVGKASMQVRKRALEKQLEADKQMYQEELNQMGKTFHVQRI